MCLCADVLVMVFAHSKESCFFYPFDIDFYNFWCCGFWAKLLDSQVTTINYSKNAIFKGFSSFETTQTRYAWIFHSFWFSTLTFINISRDNYPNSDHIFSWYHTKSLLNYENRSCVIENSWWGCLTFKSAKLILYSK